MQRFVLLALMVFISTVTTDAQKKWTLQECIVTAMENSLEVEGAMLGLEFAESNVTEAKHSRYPSLSASSNLGVSFGRSINPITDQFISQSFLSNSYGVNTGMILYNGSRLSNALKQSKLNRDASKYDTEQVKRDIALVVANTYLQVLAADENLKIAQAQLNLSQDQLTQTKKLITAGAQPANEALNIEAQIATNEQAVINAENSRIVGLLNLKQLLRLPPNEEFEIVFPDDISILSNIESISFDEVFKKALNSQPNIKSAELKLKSAILGEKIAKGAFHPSVNLGGGVNTNYASILNPPAGFPLQKAYSEQLDENLSANVGMGISIPIYNNYQNKLGSQRAKINTLQVENENAILENNLQVTVQQAITDAKAAKRKYTAAEKNEKAQAAALANAKKSFDLGAINSFEYLTLQNNAVQAEVNAVIAKYEYIFAMKIIDFYMGKEIILEY